MKLVTIATILVLMAGCSSAPQVLEQTQVDECRAEGGVVVYTAEGVEPIQCLTVADVNTMMDEERECIAANDVAAYYHDRFVEGVGPHYRGCKVQRKKDPVGDAICTYDWIKNKGDRSETSWSCRNR